MQISLNNSPSTYSFWKAGWQQFKKRKIGLFSLIVIVLFCLMAIYAPFLASSKPIFVSYQKQWFFPLFRYLFYTGFYTKPLDIFFNLLIFTFPLFLLSFLFRKKARNWLFVGIFAIQCISFITILFSKAKDPSSSVTLNKERRKAIQEQIQANKNLLQYPHSLPSDDWNFELKVMTDYAKLNMLVRYKIALEQQKIMEKYLRGHISIPSLWQIELNNQQRQVNSLKEYLSQNQGSYQEAKLNVESFLKDPKDSLPSQGYLEARQRVLQYEEALARLDYIQNKRRWLQEESQNLKFLIMPLLRPFHWQEDAGGNQTANQFLPWWELTRTNRKDLVAGLIFGTRISLVVGIISIGLALLIGIPIGAIAGFFGGTLDIIISRLIEIWESMPTFFMLLLVVAMTQSKSIFLVMTVIGLFGWTGFCRFTRGEFFKQRNLPYVEACQAMGFRNSYIMFSHILPNAIPPTLTLLPFGIMGAISSEAGLSFLGLGEEGSCSWGVLMDEGRTAFPGESYLLWPPAILLSILLIAIALVGDALRDTLDPKLRVG